MSRLVWLPGHEVLVPEIVRAENCRLFDGAGNRYVDLESGVWCASIGHGHPRIVRVLAEQAARVAHSGFNYSSALTEEAAGEILSLLGFDGGRCVFLCSGSEAVEYGVRVAQSVLEKPLLLTMTDSYFGAYGSANRKDETEWFLYDWLACPECGGPCGGECGRFGAVPFDRIGGFLFEPGSSSGLVRFPPEELIRGIVDRVHEGGGLVLVNEVTTGVGRTGEWFGFRHYGITPDVVALGKGIGNGYPVSVSAFAPGVIERLEGAPVKYAQSHQNDPLGAAVAREVLRVIDEEGLVERGAELGALLMKDLEEVRSRNGRIRAVRGRGLMIAVEFEDDPETTFTIAAHRELARRGFLVGRRAGFPVFRIDPALTVERADLEAFLGVFEDVVGSVGR
ncbi:MAG: aminotransferase class III-fold pyridoxal phosphate-dependent enzyme [Candidatus Eisenbacteria bacterium]